MTGKLRVRAAAMLMGFRLDKSRHEEGDMQMCKANQLALQLFCANISNTLGAQASMPSAL